MCFNCNNFSLVECGNQLPQRKLSFKLSVELLSRLLSHPRRALSLTTAVGPTRLCFVPQRVILKTLMYISILVHVCNILQINSLSVMCIMYLQSVLTYCSQPGLICNSHSQCRPRIITGRVLRCSWHSYNTIKSTYWRQTISIS